MPHMVTFDGLKFSGVNRANPNDSPGPTHDPDEFGGIKGGYALTSLEHGPGLHDSIKATRLHRNAAGDPLPTEEVVSALAGDVDGDSDITDAGLGNNSFHQPGDLRGNGAVHQDTPMDTHPNDNLLGSRGLHDSVHCIVGGTMCSVVSKDADALVQQVNDSAGLINPDSMRPAEYFSHNPEWFAPGSSVDSWIEKTFGTGDGEHTFGGISEGNAFAPVNELRSDNRF